MLPLAKYSVDVSLGEAPRLLLECFAHGGGFDKERQEKAMEGYVEHDEEDDEIKDEGEDEHEVNESEPVERAKRKSRPRASSSPWTKRWRRPQDLAAALACRTCSQRTGRPFVVP